MSDETEKKPEPDPRASPDAYPKPMSINEPYGSEVFPPPPEPEVDPPEDPVAALESDPLPSDAELAAMTRAQLDDLAAERGVDITGCTTKAQVIEALQDDAEE